MGFDGAGGGLVELGERQNCPQTPTSRALLLRDLERGLEGFLGGGGIRGIALEQDLAAEAMQEGEAVAILRLARKRQRLFHARERALRSVGL